MTAVDLASTWTEPLLDLANRLRRAARTALLDAVERCDVRDLMRPHSIGAGDVTYGIDVPAEDALSAWLDEMARTRPISLLTEDAGWRHRGPAKTGGAVDLAGFDHGGPRIVVDPIDGTRNLMADLRSAWSVIGLCANGEREPRIADVEIGVLAEIPDSRGASARVLHAVRGRGAEQRLVRLGAQADSVVAKRALIADRDDRADHGYFPFFRYMADMRPEIARIEADFFARLEREERAEIRTCYDDQYISNGGQLALLALGTYRMIADLRAFLAEKRARPTMTSKPYDVSGALLVAREAGCVVTHPDGSELDFPLDVTTHIGFVGWANQATRRRLERHLAAAIGR